MPVRIVDSSAIAAILFGEPTLPEVTERLRGHSLVAPVLLIYELSNVCLKKTRALPRERDRFLAGFQVWKEMGIDLVAVDFDGVLALAERFALSSYDASYLSLAQNLSAELVTLDQRLARAAVSLR
jgi:predicted nucleic acid-binding protein